MNRWLTLACAALASTVLAGCVDDRGSEARSIGTKTRELPGVDTVEVDYKNDFTNGEFFDLDVGLATAATTDQAQDVVHTFVSAAHGVEFDTHYTELKIGNDKGNVTLRPLSGTGTDVVAQWFDVMSSPVVERVAMGADHPAIVTLRQPVDTGAAEELLRRHPELDGAQWLLQVPKSSEFESTSTYTSYGVIPDAATQQAWTEIVRVAGPHLVIGEFGTDPTTDRPVSTIEISMKPHTEPRDDEIATAAAAALAELDRPVDLIVKGGHRWVEITIDGCFRHEKAHVPSVLEAELARTYERC
ncbi:hypothetical protein [Mycolicibacterium fortuitum]|uniref:Secreted protein n=2 Tax=Mycolicibacterium fortuitum TaxID=1766 RepID=A0AAE4VCQ2_MYCFO|nr:hypothetical protein [Mycolicibacterium fortuitum]MCA4726312.1 hypothetical protein [Mycolicibacterium fortuitum]MCV7140981.1 hypothetical protein [Mycolicibacterium fortuitum]MDV7192786.1 hypothetical protein [Mycolicibacterium fortuitum]MDV7205686.1 hypothetical protein [Mycolicibacterium fortuitum]MDV7229320.1 hypothetical protein [Mycolicibacterium fortuitum]